MASETSFDLNLAIQRWRENLAQSPAFRSENLHELESHLRDSVGVLQAKGLSAEEAFWIASRRIGSAPQLETEFGKVNRKTAWADRIFWMLIGFQIWTLASHFLLAVILPLYKIESPKGHEILVVALGLILPPLAAGLVTLIVWKGFSKSQTRALLPMELWLAKPFALAAGLFVISIGVELFSACFQYAFLYSGVHNWWIVGLISSRYLSEFALVAGLVFVFARKRLRLGLIAD